MPTVTIHYKSVSPHLSVEIHAWERAGQTYHLPGQYDATTGWYTFILERVGLAALRELSFKFYFPGTSNPWESDDYIRAIPERDVVEVWTYDFTRRCLTSNPDLFTGSPIAQVTFQVLTKQKFAGGKLYAWSPITQQSITVNQSSRDDTHQLSTFDLTLQPWMQQGFYFKLIDHQGNYESDRNIRIWLPIDGSQVWLKGDQMDMRSQRTALVSAPVEVIHPNTSSPQLQVIDDSEGLIDTLDANSTIPLTGDPLFVRSHYPVTVYPGATYTLKLEDEPEGRKFRIPFDLLDTLTTSVSIRGDYQWFDPPGPVRNATVELVIHPNAQSQFGDSIALDIGIGTAPAHEQVTATRQADGTWKAQFSAFSTIQQWGQPGSDEPPEYRRGVKLESAKRLFRPDRSGLLQLHTLDAIAGVSLQPPQIQDVPLPERKQRMAAAYSPAIANAGVFAPDEMPLGVVVAGNTTYFTLCAPHAVRAELLILQAGTGATTPRQVDTHEMSLTPDLRYFWCDLPASQTPQGTHYRFRLNDTQEVIDPASRWVHASAGHWAQSGEGLEGPWSRIVDPAQIAQHLAGSSWRTMGWEALLIYEMHAARFSQRHPAAQNVFDYVTYELGTGGYLKDLGVTALEFLPLNEFPSQNSWGYNVSLYFAIESSYGSPEAFAQLVRACHDAGKAVILDVVYNHFNDCPLSFIARDVYAKGETIWGDMPNYGHPDAFEFFRQNLVYLWHTFKLDGFRFDCALAIIDGHKPNGYIIRQVNGQFLTGSDRGWFFLKDLREAVRKAADAENQPWPYLVGEIDPTNWPASDPTSGVLDGQWHFEHHYRLGDAAWASGDKSSEIIEEMQKPHNLLLPYYEAVRYGESHDSVAQGEDWKKRIAARAPYGIGLRMAKAIGTAALLAMGIPMLFMGEEAGETSTFFIGDDHYRLPLDNYLNAQDYRNKVLTWFRVMMGFRNNPSNGLRGDDHQTVGRGYRTIAFTRSGGRFFVICTFDTPDNHQNSGWLCLPGGTAYKEIFNSSWPAYAVENESEFTNGGYNARIYSGNIVHLPSTGALILERC